MSQKILFVDDQPKEVHALSQALKGDGHHIDMAGDLAGAREYVLSADYSLIVLDREIRTDRGLEDGLSFCREFRNLGTGSRIVFFTNLVSPGDHREGWAAGADDYIEKSWPHETALARCRAHLSRAAEQVPSAHPATKIFRHANVPEERHLVVEEASLIVARQEEFELVKHGALSKARMSIEQRERYKKAKMTDLDLAVFFELYKRPNEWVTEEELLRKVWGYSERRIEAMMTDPDANSGLVHTTVSRIRRKIDTRLERLPESAGQMDNRRPWACIETNSEVGQDVVSYRFNANQLHASEFPIMAKN